MEAKYQRRSRQDHWVFADCVFPTLQASIDLSAVWTSMCNNWKVPRATHWITAGVKSFSYPVVVCLLLPNWRGVPLGSILGPLLFNLHMLPQVIINNKISYHSYADFTQIYITTHWVTAVPHKQWVGADGFRKTRPCVYLQYWIL